MTAIPKHWAAPHSFRPKIFSYDREIPYELQWGVLIREWNFNSNCQYYLRTRENMTLLKKIIRYIYGYKIRIRKYELSFRDFLSSVSFSGHLSLDAMKTGQLWSSELVVQIPTVAGKYLHSRRNLAIIFTAVRASIHCGRNQFVYLSIVQNENWKVTRNHLSNFPMTRFWGTSVML